MSFPKISIIFKTAASSMIQRSQSGIVALILRDSAGVGQYLLDAVSQIPDALSNDNKFQIQQAFHGGVYAPSKVLVVVQDSATAKDYSDALKYLETVKWNYLAVPAIASTDTAAIVAEIKSMRDNKSMPVKAVLPHSASDYEGIINLTTDDIQVGSSKYTAAQYCSRIAGILAGCPLTTSVTFQTLSEVDDVPHLTEDEAAAKIDAGELVLYQDGEKVKIARGVTSLTTITGKSDEFKKIKIMDTLDAISYDIKKTVNDNYIGKVANSYDNKCLLISAINAYLEGLEPDILEKGGNECAIDIDAQKTYIKSKNVAIPSDVQKIKEFNTGDKVFLAASVQPIDCMEEINLNINL